MCELLGMSARRPDSLSASLGELARHGGLTGPHVDGWGVGLVDDGDALVVREPTAASASAWMSFLREHAPPSALVLAHVRRATQGPRLLRNSQPFARELGGRMHLFVHNGMLPGIEDDARFAARRFRRIGDTDSEHAFCALLERLAPAWEAGVPSVAERHREVAAFARALATLGPANFLYTDGDVLFAHGHRRRGDDGVLRSPGLHVRCRRCAAAAAGAPGASASAAVDGDGQEVTLFASVPLTGEAWRPLAEGELLVARAGRLIDVT